MMVTQTSIVWDAQWVKKKNFENELSNILEGKLYT